jgi:hypothetical protein
MRDSRRQRGADQPAWLLAAGRSDLPPRAGRIGRTGSSGSGHASADTVAMALIITALPPEQAVYNGSELRARPLRSTGPQRRAPYLQLCCAAD